MSGIQSYFHLVGPLYTVWEYSGGIDVIHEVDSQHENIFSVRDQTVNFAIVKLKIQVNPI